MPSTMTVDEVRTELRIRKKRCELVTKQNDQNDYAKKAIGKPNNLRYPF